MMRALTLLIAMVWLLPADSSGQARPTPVKSPAAQVSVHVYDDSSGTPLAGAHLVVLGKNLGAYSDANGLVRINGIPPGPHHLSLSMLGYATTGIDVEFDAGAVVEAELRLAPAPVPLPPLDVTAAGGLRRDPTLAQLGFYDRQRYMGGGATFIAGERLEALTRRSSRLTDAFQQVAGIRVGRNPKGTGLVLLSSRRGFTETGVLRCYPQVYVDGMNTRYFDPERGKAQTDNVDVNRLVSLQDVSGIEVYPGEPSPVEYEKNSCGIVLIWTRRGNSR